MNQLTQITDIINNISSPFVEVAQKKLQRLIDSDIRTTEDLMQKATDSSVDDELRVFIVWLLGRLKAYQAIPALQEILNQETEHSLRHEAIQSLAMLGDVSLKGKLSKMLKNTSDTELHVSAVCGLRLLDVDMNRSLLLDVATGQTHSKRVRVIAIDALSDIREEFETVSDALLPLLTHDDTDIRLSTAHTLGQIGRQAHIADLKQLTSDTETVSGFGTVGDAAQYAIKLIEKQNNSYYWRLNHDKLND